MYNIVCACVYAHECMMIHMLMSEGNFVEFVLSVYFYMTSLN